MSCDAFGLFLVLGQAGLPYSGVAHPRLEDVRRQVSATIVLTAGHNRLSAALNCWAQLTYYCKLKFDICNDPTLCQKRQESANRDGVAIVTKRFGNGHIAHGVLRLLHFI